MCGRWTVGLWTLDTKFWTGEDRILNIHGLKSNVHCPTSKKGKITAPKQIAGQEVPICAKNVIFRQLSVGRSKEPHSGGIMVAA
jgi:hypothetical protein